MRVGYLYIYIYANTYYIGPVQCLYNTEYLTSTLNLTIAHWTTIVYDIIVAQYFLHQELHLHVNQTTKKSHAKQCDSKHKNSHGFSL